MTALRHILGTGTGAGKTHVTGLLLEMAASRRLRALPLKPVHSGWPEAVRWGEDLAAHARSIPPGLGPDDLCRFHFREPISPFSAAELEGRAVSLGELAAFLDRARQSLPADLLLAEGVGGVCCPLGPRLTYLDLLRARPAPALLVSGVGLGSLNHAILSVRALESVGLAPLALVLDEERAFPAGDLPSSRARRELERLVDCHVTGPLKRDDRAGNLRVLAAELPASFWAAP